MNKKKGGYANIVMIMSTFVVLIVSVVAIYIVTQPTKKIVLNNQTTSTTNKDDVIETKLEIVKVIEDEESYITIVKHMDHEHIIDSKEIYEYAKDKIGESVKGYSTYDDLNNNHTIDMILK